MRKRLGGDRSFPSCNHVLWSLFVGCRQWLPLTTNRGGPGRASAANRESEAWVVDWRFRGFEVLAEW